MVSISEPKGTLGPDTPPLDAEKQPEITPTASSTPSSETAPEAAPPPKKGLGFWMIMASLAISMFLSALDLTAVTTALPTITNSLQSHQFSWIGSSYALSGTAFLPVFGGLADAFGRKINMQVSIVLFAVGSAICGAAPNMSAMIAGRTIQGIGGGGILAMSEIVVADLVALSERGLFMGIFGLVWALASAIGPVTGGAIAQGNWRWLFYMNIPISALALALVTYFMQLRIPPGKFTQKLKSVDWIGSVLFVIASTLIILGLTFGGDQFPWKSAGTLAPLTLGLVFLPIFVLAEKRGHAHPILPFEIFNRTTVVGYLTTFIHGAAVMALVYFLPAWFISVKGHSPVRSGVDLFPVSFLIAPFAIICGISVTILQKYKWQNVIAWAFVVVGSGLFTILKSTTSTGTAAGLQVPIAIGLGLLYSGSTFPVLAPLPMSANAKAMSFHAFSRAFGQVIGITIGTVCLTNGLSSKLPAEFITQLPGGTGSAYSAINEIVRLPEPLRSSVRKAFSDSIRLIWFVLIGFGAVGLFASFFMKNLSLSATTDESWGLEAKNAQKPEDHAV